MEQNETGCQAPLLCVNNCGFFGTTSTMNMCSKCYKDSVLKQEQAKLAASSIQSIVNGSSSSSVVLTTAKAHAATSDIVVVAPPQAPATLPPPAEKIVEEVKEGPKRCGTCNKRVGLTGFTCRCGSILCSVHRYSDKHDCQFDYHSAAQEAIAKANPVVKAEKIEKI
ncbi:hypothetical protein CASFOL_033898 [Castilleja foliolosa]|uniref:Uncharacterized protein n=1 Tax=Castilleja foliolosa TaxID=1961234 RepID=A0ABD3C0W3_9LAMI